MSRTNIITANGYCMQYMRVKAITDLKKMSDQNKTCRNHMVSVKN